MSLGFGQYGTCNKLLRKKVILNLFEYMLSPFFLLMIKGLWGFVFFFPSRFAAKTVHSGSLMLVTVELKEGSTAQLIINTEKTVIGSVLLRELKPVLSQG